MTYKKISISKAKVHKLIESLANKKNGFALIISLSIMSLILLFMLAAIQMVQVSVRSSENHVNLQIAKQNALLGLDLALSDLQKYMGPDQRVSARADINNDLQSHPTKSHIVGAWDTRSFTRNHNSLDQPSDWPKWLVSQNNQYSIESSVATDSDVALLFPNSNSEKRIYGSKLFLTNGENQRIGSYAWAVDDQGLKASIRQEVINDYQDSLNSRMSLSQSYGNSLIYIGGSFENSGANKNRLSRLLSFSQIPLALNLNERDSKSFLDYQYSNFAVESYGVLSDVRNGGLKKDLSLAFAMSDSDFNSDPIFSGDYKNLGQNFSAGFVFEESTPDGTIKGPTWQLLRSHYKLPESLTNTKAPTINARGYSPTPSDINAVTTYNAENHHISWFNFYGELTSEAGRPEIDSSVAYRGITKTNVPRPTSPTIAPILLRSQVVVSMDAVDREAGDPTTGMTVAEETAFTRKLRVVLDFNFVIWNPYNVTITVPAMAFEIRDIPLVITYTNFQNVYAYESTGNTAADRHGFRASGGWGGSKMIEIFPYDSSQSRVVLAYEPVGGITLAPGETRVISSNNTTPSPYALSVGANSGVEVLGGIATDTPVNRNSSDFYLYLRDTSVVQARIQVDTGGGSEPRTRMSAYLAPSGITATLAASSNPKVTLRTNPDVTRLNYYDGFITVSNQSDPTQTLDYDELYNNKIPIAAQEMYFKTTTEGSSNAFRSSQYNYRAHTFLASTQSLLGYNNLPAPISYNIRTVTDWINDLLIHDGISSNAYWGDSLDGTGSTHVSLYELPTKPMISLLEFRHLNMELPLYHFNYVMGNGSAHTMIDKDETYSLLNVDPSTSWVAINGGGVFLSDYYAYDVPYLMNEALLDSYFFSGITEQVGSLFNSETSLSQNMTNFAEGNLSGTLNKRLIPYKDTFSKSGFSASDLVSGSNAASGSHEKIAAALMTQAAFNINSTSARAWASILGDAQNTSIEYYDGSLNTQTEQQDYIHSRFSLPSGSRLTSNDAFADKAFWKGFTSLKKDQIYNDSGTVNDDSDDTGLAVEIVKAIKKRGPFLNMSDFVSRRLVDNDLGIQSAMTEAIENSQLNASTSDYYDTVTTSNYPAGLPYPEHGVGPLGDAFPGFIQADDILTRILPFLSPRSDTFVIRSLGQSINPINGSVNAQILCEATVQRIPDPVIPSTQASGNTSDFRPNDLNVMGRQFRIIAFRFLSPENITNN